MRTLILAMILSLASFAAAGDARSSYVAGHFAFDLDGVKCGFIHSVEGGGINAAVIEEEGGMLPAKHLGPLMYDSFTIQSGLAMGQPLKDWIAAALDAQYQRKSGEITVTDFKYKAMHTRSFQEAVLTKIGFPACDVASKEVGYLTVTFAVDRSSHRKGDGATIDRPQDMSQTQWRPADFRFSVDGIDCTQVMSIDPFMFSIVTDQRLFPVRIVVPNLRIVAAGRSGAAFTKWANEFIFEGQNDPGKEKSGTLEFLDPSRKKSLLTLTLRNLGIFSLTPEPKPEDPDRVELKLYAEAATLVDDDPEPPTNQ
jgi:hypothetical protein